MKFWSRVLLTTVTASVVMGSSSTAFATPLEGTSNSPEYNQTESGFPTTVVEVEPGVFEEYVTLDDGREATLIFDEFDGTFTIEASDGSSVSYDRNQIDQAIAIYENGEPVMTTRSTSCSVATGLLGVGHSALWGLAVGGPAGAAAGAAAGVFWVGVSSFGCGSL